MNPSTVKVEPLGDRGLVIELGQGVDAEVNRRVCALAARIAAARIDGVLDIVPSFTTVGVHYSAEAVPTRADETPHAAILRLLEPLLQPASHDLDAETDPVIDIPVCYGGEYGPDLEEAAALCEMTASELIALHQRTELRVYMIGFAPGAPYIGLLDERLSLPRRATPRTQVPGGTVAIANRQSVIYPFTAPGGWNLIGRTPLVLFDPLRDPPGLLRPGTRVRFRAVDEGEFASLEVKA